MKRIQLVLATLLTATLLSGCGKHYSLAPNASFPEDYTNLVDTWELCERCLNQGLCEKGGFNRCMQETLPSRDHALNKAISRANLRAVKYLVNTAGADVNSVTGKYKETPLHIAAYYRSPRHYEVTEFLISKGAKLDEMDNSTFPTPLLTAMWKNNIPTAKLLLKHGANPNITEGRAVPACYFAVWKSQLELVTLIPGCCEKVPPEIDNQAVQQACASPQD